MPSEQLKWKRSGRNNRTTGTPGAILEYPPNRGEFLTGVALRAPRRKAPAFQEDPVRDRGRCVHLLVFFLLLVCLGEQLQDRTPKFESRPALFGCRGARGSHVVAWPGFLPFGMLPLECSAASGGFRFRWPRKSRNCSKKKTALDVAILGKLNVH